MTTVNRGRYRDLDATFLPHPGTGDVRRRFDADAIKFAVKNLVMTRYYERLFQPNIGSNVSNILFEQAHPLTTQLLQSAIENVIKNYEPRVKLESVDVTPNYDDGEYIVTIRFTIINTAEPVMLTMALERTR